MRFILALAALLSIQHSLAFDIFGEWKKYNCADEMQQCGEDWYRTTPEKCVKYFNLTLAFNEAKSHCECQNSSLASILDHEENDKLRCVILRQLGRALGQQVGAYIAAFSYGGMFKSFGGTRLDFMKHPSAFPPSSLAELWRWRPGPRCVETVDGDWRIVECSQKRSFFCSRSCHSFPDASLP